MKHEKNGSHLIPGEILLAEAIKLSDGLSKQFKRSFAVGIVTIGLHTKACLASRAINGMNACGCTERLNIYPEWN